MVREIFRILLKKDFTLRGIWVLGRALLRGTYYIVRYAVTRRNVTIRFPFIAYAPVRILGKGTVFIDEKCSVFYSNYSGLTIVTLSPDARVSIGKRCDLGGLTIRCRNSVKLGDKVMTASSLVQDVALAHDTQGTTRMNPDWKRYENREIIIGNHVWLCGMSCVLGGAVLHDDCVLSVGSCLYDNESNEYSLLMGNPVRRMFQIDKLLRLRGVQ